MAKFSNPPSVSRFLAGLCLALGILAAPAAHAQEAGSVAGVIVSTWDGSLLNGVTVTVRGTTLAAQTDALGKYQLNGVPAGDQVLRISKSGYAAAVVTDVRVLPGQTTTVNGNLRPEFYEMEEYEVTAEEFQQQTEQIVFERQQSSSVMDSLGSEQFSKLGAGDAAEIVARVTGVTIVEGKFAVIRGLNDRYTSTLLNGAEIPSADPYRKAAQLDMFPSEMIDRVNISKNFTPDQPGGFAGGSIDLITKPFPKEKFISFSAGVAYNTQSTGNDQFLTGPEGDQDYLAMDDGFRDVPPGYLTSGQGPPSFTRNPAVAEDVVSQVNSFEDPLFAPTRDAPGPDTDWAVSAGGSWNLFNEARLGLIGGLNHSIKYRYAEDAEYTRYNGTSDGGLEFIRGYERDRGQTETQWGAVVGVALELNPQHRFSYALVNNQSAENVGQYQQGTSAVLGEIALAYKGYTERNLFNQQFKGEHEFPVLARIRFNWLASLSESSQDEPSLRYYPMQIFPLDNGDYFITSAGADIPDARAPTIYTRNLADENQNYRFDWAVPFSDEEDLPKDIKFGLNLSSSEREYDDQRLLFNINEIVGPQTGQPETFPNEKLNLADYGYRIDRRGNYIFDHPIQRLQNSYEGSTEIPAGYVMGDWSFGTQLRVTAGARYEETDMKVTAPEGNGSIEQQDWLPAVALTWKLRPDMNLRFSYAQTVGRPTYREFAPVSIYDFYSDEFVRGNPNLTMTGINNYDARWEWFLGTGDLLSAGVFYKELADPIEKYVTRQITTVSFINRPEATLYGFELEARKNLAFLADALSGFSVGGNFTYTWANVVLAPDIDLDGTVFFPGGERDAMYEQSPYIINADLSYDHVPSGFAVTLSYNLAGERLVVAGSNSPDIYEQPAGWLGLVISKRLGKHWTIKASAKNLLNPEIEQIYGKYGEYPGFGPYSSYTRGTTYSLSLSADF